MAIFEKTQSIRLVKRATIAALRYANIETINKPRRDGYSSPEFYEPEIFVASGSLIAAANCLFHADNIKSMTPKAFVEAFPLPSKTLAVPFGPQEGKDRIYPFGGGYKFGDWMQSEYKKTKVAEISVREIDKNKWKHELDIMRDAEDQLFDRLTSVVVFNIDKRIPTIFSASSNPFSSTKHEIIVIPPTEKPTLKGLPENYCVTVVLCPPLSRVSSS